eukprot:TRINITY_DN1770_c3_g1_i1.p1 TRINITY_DN1770_c3_g1~~TRINITY_DN1770_c3_g1_i1.p1  ORF type:complete len:489 (+),score=93.97 TRINITY_DN1770_c3_g1_i1:219-1685(+)
MGLCCSVLSDLPEEPIRDAKSCEKAPILIKRGETYTNLRSESQRHVGSERKFSMRYSLISNSTACDERQRGAQFALFSPPSFENCGNSLTQVDFDFPSDSNSSPQSPPYAPPKIPSVELDDDIRKRRLHDIKKGVFESEKTYVDGLTRACDYYMEPLKQMLDASAYRRKPDASTSIVDTMFGHLLTIRACNVLLLKAMRQAIENDPAACSAEPDFSSVDFAPVFVDNFKLLRLYAAYINDYDKLSFFIESPSTPSKFRTFLLKTEEETKESLWDILITPIQRMIHYRMFMQTLIRYSKGEEVTALSRAIEEIGTVCQYCNQKKREADGNAKVAVIECELGIKDLYQPGRYWIMDSEMDRVVVGKKTERCHVYLFSDLLLVVRTSTWGLSKKPIFLPLDDIVDVIVDTGMVHSDTSSSSSFFGSKPLGNRGTLAIETSDFDVVLAPDTHCQFAVWMEATKSAFNFRRRRTLYMLKKRSTIGIDLNDSGM